jgi:hypothetical protein
MDIGRLRTTADALLREESRLAVDAKVAAIVNWLTNLASNPAEPSYQLELRNAVDALKATLEQTDLERDPSYISYGSLIGADRFFSTSLLGQIVQAIGENGITPAVARDRVHAIYNDRQSFVHRLVMLVDALSGLGIGPDNLPAGESQIGFRVPREMFDNELTGWISELNEVRRIIRPFSELSTGSAEPLKMGEVSSSDPIVFLILNISTVATIATAISWCIDQWKKVEEIRNLRAQTAKLDTDVDKNILDGLTAKFDEMIEQRVSRAVNEQAIRFVEPTSDAGRHNELVTEMERSLRSLLARIERGMTVELKLIAKAKDDASAEDNQAADTIIRIMPQLAFPSPSGSPTLSLPRSDTQS